MYINFLIPVRTYHPLNESLGVLQSFDSHGDCGSIYERKES